MNATILDTEEIAAFKRGIEDYLEMGCKNESERFEWTSYYYKRGYEYGRTLYESLNFSEEEALSLVGASKSQGFDPNVKSIITGEPLWPYVTVEEE